jgi:hypothetical protein
VGCEINALGARFHDETQGYSEAAVHVLAQPGGTAWNVFDDRLLAFAQDFPDFRDAQAAGRCTAWPMWRRWRNTLVCPVDTLRHTLDAVHEGQDPVTGRHFKRSLEAPFHAIRVTGALFHTQGGLDINAQCQVLRPDGSALPNLLAAGARRAVCRAMRLWGCLSGQWAAQRHRGRLYCGTHGGTEDLDAGTHATPHPNLEGDPMNLKQRLNQPEVLLAPGVYDAFSALIAEQAGFEALYVSGASVAYTLLGRSDIGLTTASEVAHTLAHITDRVRAARDRGCRHRLWQRLEHAARRARL